MDELSPKARALIASGRNAYRPESADRTRIEAALRARLGEAVLPSAPSARWPLLGGATLGACLGTIAALMALHSPQAPQLRAAAVPSAVRYVVAPRVVAADEPRVAPAPAPAVVPDRPMKPPRAARPDPLSQEVLLLTRATRELNAGHARRALPALVEHQQRFPNGKLSEERRAAKAQVLCALGRVSEGRAEQAQLVPHSPAAARAKQVCDAAARDTQR